MGVDIPEFYWSFILAGVVLLFSTVDGSRGGATDFF